MRPPSYYPGVTDNGQLGRQVARDVVFTAFARRIAYLHSAKAPTWRYYFSHAGHTPTGAGHGAEVPFVFGTVEQCQCLGGPPTPLDYAVARRVGDRWTAFAGAGKPAGEPPWEPDNRSRGWAIEIGDEEAGRPGFMMARLNAFITGLNLIGRKR